MVFKYPYPYQAWFTLSNDPDFTGIKEWHELNDFIWKELQLPLANSLFVKSFNQNLPEQVNLVDHPEILSQPHDTIHTWGDYMHGRKRGFDREDAIEAIEILKGSGIFPKVWIDHSKFPGNLLHNASGGAIPETKDMSGNVYKNYFYTLDLIHDLGIRYVWNGKLTHWVGQDSKRSALSYLMSKNSNPIKVWVKYLMYKMSSWSKFRKKLNVEIPSNLAYQRHSFSDGNEMYLFYRYGTWKDADIYGLGQIIAPDKIETLIARNGSMIAYTHLGKKPVGKEKVQPHIPEKTRMALQNIKKQHDSGKLMVSPLSQMLDYMIIRDQISVDVQNNSINFRSDNLRFKPLFPEDLIPHRFTFSALKLNTTSLNVYVDNKNIAFNFEMHPEIKGFSISFNTK